MGSHVVSYKGKKGVSFMVWAPNAKCVYLSGEFNNWSIDSHPMTNLYHSGVWGIFIDNLSEGEKYKYNVIGCDGISRLKSDPYATFSELRPNTASVVYDIGNYEWSDNKWQECKSKKICDNEPMNIYEVNLGSWKRKWDMKNYMRC